MVLIGYSGVEEPRPSYFWNARSACTAERWKMDADLEAQKIDKMTRGQLIEYIVDLTVSSSLKEGSAPSNNMRKQFTDLIGKNFQDGRRADIVFKVTMKSIFEKIQSRLNDVNLIDLECIYNTNDIKSIQAVMNGNISTSDYTALCLVYQRMVRRAKELETTKQRIENRKHSRNTCRVSFIGFKILFANWMSIPKALQSHILHLDLFSFSKNLL